MTWLALDIGGANLKVSDGQQHAACCPLALWKQPQQLAVALRRLLADAPDCHGVAVTMTGELADCFASKAEGVHFILKATVEAAARREVRVYLTDGWLVAPAVAAADPRLAAASNWHALACFAGRYVATGSALLIDVGSTTCDIIPLLDGEPRPIGRTDTARLVHGELVYTGVERSPVCAITSRVPYRGQLCPLAQELFATARDVYLVLEELPEDPHDHETADGRPATRDAALARLARMLCADRDAFEERDGVALACAIADAQAAHVEAAVRQVIARGTEPPAAVILSGHGEFLRGAPSETWAWPCRWCLWSTDSVPRWRVAPAYALAVLAREAFEA